MNLLKTAWIAAGHLLLAPYGNYLPTHSETPISCPSCLPKCQPQFWKSGKCYMKRTAFDIFTFFTVLLKRIGRETRGTNIYWAPAVSQPPAHRFNFSFTTPPEAGINLPISLQRKHRLYRIGLLETIQLGAEIWASLSEAFSLSLSVLTQLNSSWKGVWAQAVNAMWLKSSSAYRFPSAWVSVTAEITGYTPHHFLNGTCRE